MKHKIDTKQSIPLIIIKNRLIFPQMITHLDIQDETNKKNIKTSMKNNQLVFISLNSNKVGTVALIMNIEKNDKSKSYKILIQGIFKAKISTIKENNVFYNIQEDEKLSSKEKHNFGIIHHRIKIFFDRLEDKKNQKDIVFMIEKLNDSRKITDLLLSKLFIDLETMQKIFEINNPLKRLEKLYFLILDMFKKKKYNFLKTNFSNQENILTIKEMALDLRTKFKNISSDMEIHANILINKILNSDDIDYYYNDILSLCLLIDKLLNVEKLTNKQKKEIEKVKNNLLMETKTNTLN